MFCWNWACWLQNSHLKISTLNLNILRICPKMCERGWILKDMTKLLGERLTAFRIWPDMALSKEPPLSLKYMFWWFSICHEHSFLPSYRRKCYMKYLSTNSFEKIFNYIFWIHQTDDTSHAPKTHLASEFCVVTIPECLLFLDALFSCSYITK